MPSLDPGSAVNFGAVSVSGSGQGERLPLVTLDSLALPHCRLIKIDVEGMDFEVLRGGSATIERCRPFIYMEAKKGEATAAAIAGPDADWRHDYREFMRRRDTP